MPKPRPFKAERVGHPEKPNQSLGVDVLQWYHSIVNERQQKKHERGSHPPSNLQHHSELSLTMKLPLGLVMLVTVACALVACHTTQPPVTTEILAGNYTFVSKDPESRATDHSLDRLVLRSDGTYDLVEGGTTKVVLEKKGVWRIEPGSPSNVVNVVLDHAGYPIEIKKNEIRLLIDLDTGVWWVKPR
jgi:hypothetical protein